ncbi:MAG: TolC family protein [Planctomycetes bacterium]|nr:TolC family protein [Planctomycetota bacterium]
MHIALRPKRVPQGRAVFALGVLLLAAGSCRSPAEQRAAADREVYALIERRRAELGNREKSFTIEPNPESLRRRLERGEVAELAPLSLVQCLDIAAENSRDFQTQRESLYLSALDLTLERYRFRVQETGSLGALLTGDGEGATDASFDGGLGFSKLLGTGMAIVGNIGLSMARDLTRADAFDLVSNASLGITQPLLAGANPRIVREPLTQAERNVVYAARSYERFRRTYAVDVASRVYRILQQADTVVNEENNYNNLQVLRQRNEALAESGRLSAIEVDQARQDELRSRNRLVQERQRYESLIDDFKTFLGLPVPIPLSVDPEELARLSAEEPESFDLEALRLDELALGLRLDHQTVLDRADDSARAVEVAADALRSRLTVSADASMVSQEGKPLEFRNKDVDWQLGLDLDLALDRFPERNRYREALIRQESSRREVEESGDTIRVAVRDDLRDTAATLEGYRIQRLAVELAERRIEGANLNLEAGRATTRDLLEAQEALLEARNAATAALINYQLARLALFRDLELLRVDERGIAFERELLTSAASGGGAPPGALPAEPSAGQDRGGGDGLPGASTELSEQRP